MYEKSLKTNTTKNKHNKANAAFLKLLFSIGSKTIGKDSTKVFLISLVFKIESLLTPFIFFIKKSESEKFNIGEVSILFLKKLFAL